MATSFLRRNKRNIQRQERSGQSLDVLAHLNALLIPLHSRVHESLVHGFTVHDYNVMMYGLCAMQELARRNPSPLMQAAARQPLHVMMTLAVYDNVMYPSMEQYKTLASGLALYETLIRTCRLHDLVNSVITVEGHMITNGCDVSHGYAKAIRSLIPATTDWHSM